MLRERILILGGPGSGKTFSWLQLARRFKNSTFYVMDTEIGAVRSLQEFPDIKNVVVYPVVDWPEYRDALKRIMAKATSDNWIIVDMMDKAWGAVQRYFIDQIFDKEMGEYFLEARKKVKKDAKSLFAGRDAALKGWTDWPVINKLYEDFAQSLIYRAQSHLLMTTSAQAVSEEDEQEVRELYGPYGIKPVGQKNLGYQPDTVLLLSHNKAGYFMTTIKDRGGRQYVEKMKLVRFDIQYGKIAGWL